MNSKLWNFWFRISPAERERGASSAEYALATVLIAIVAIVALVVVGEETSELYSEIADELAANG